MCTIGYGDVTPETTIERIYVSVVALLSCGLFGYALSSSKIYFRIKK